MSTKNKSLHSLIAKWSLIGLFGVGFSRSVESWAILNDGRRSLRVQMSPRSKRHHRLATWASLGALLFWSVAIDPCLGETSCCCSTEDAARRDVSSTSSAEDSGSSCCSSSNTGAQESAKTSEESERARVCSCERSVPPASKIETQKIGCSTVVVRLLSTSSWIATTPAARAFVPASRAHRTPPVRGPPIATGLS